MTRRLDAAESATNAAVGLVLSVAVTYTALPLFGLYPSLSASVGITAMFTAVSFARNYAIRRIFRGLG